MISECAIRFTVSLQVLCKLLYSDLREPYKIIICSRMRLALNGVKIGLDLSFSAPYATLCRYYRHVLFVFAVNRHNSRILSTLGA